MSSVQYLQAYELKIGPQPAPFSVVRFTGHDRISDLYRYEITFTSVVASIPMDKVLGRPARFVATPIDPEMATLRKMFGENAQQFSKMPAAHNVNGIITRFEELGASADETLYRVVLEPKLADLARAPTSRLFQKQNVEEIITSTLRHDGFGAGVDFVFRLRGKYRRHEYVTQYQETTFAFIQRLCAQEGLWFRWEQGEDRVVLVFGDDLDAYGRKQRVVPWRPDAGLESSGLDAIKTLERHTQRVPEAVRLHDYNHRQADVSLLVEQNSAPNDKTTGAVDYRWGEHYLSPDEGRRIARLRHEAWLAEQITYLGTGNPFWLEAGEVMRFEPNPVDARYGIFVTSVTFEGGRNKAVWMSFKGIPADRVWRTPLSAIEQPRIEGVLPARVSSPGNYKYAYLTEEGWYVVVMPFDLDTWSPGGTSRPVRFAKPYSGDNYGHHFPLVDGAEVALVFTAGDPDRPVMIGAMHDSMHPDLVNNLNHTRNLIRTAAQNELRMEDREQIEHIHLTTPFETSELNLGHMVDRNRKERGRGAELRTDGRVAIRGAKGVFLSADGKPGAEGKQLDMAPARGLLERALEQMQALSEAAKAANAIAVDYEKQKALLNGTLNDLRQAGLLASAPDGMGLVSGSHLQLSAAENMVVTAGGSADVGVKNNFTVVAGGAVSLLALQNGMKLLADKGRAELLAHSDEMLIAALKDLNVTSTNGRLVLSAEKEVWIGAGGSYIRVSSSGIENGTPGSILERCSTWNKPGPVSVQPVLPLLPKSICIPCLLAEYSQGALLGTK